MTVEFKPFKSQEARDKFLAHLKTLETSWPIPYEEKMVPTSFGETFARICGPESAPPLVLLPGGQSNSLIWRRLVGPLSERFRIYALDAIYDEGRSVPTAPVRTVDELRQWLDQVLDGLELEQDITLAGLSYGCYAAAEYALHAPRRLRKLVWIAPVMLGAPLSQEFIDRLKPLADGKRESLEDFCRWVMPHSSSNNPEEFNHRIDEILLVRECYGEMMPPVRAAVMSDDDLKRIATPTLYILGEKDGATTDAHEALERINFFMPNVETMLVPKAGHDVVASDSQLLIQTILHFAA